MKTTINAFITRLIMTVMISLIVGLFVKAIEKEPAKVLSQFATTVISMDCISPENNQVVFMSDNLKYTTLSFIDSWMNTSVIVTERLYASNCVSVDNLSMDLCYPANVTPNTS